MCSQALDVGDDGIHPSDAGFSRNRPYMSVLRWLEKQELVTVESTGKGKSQLLAMSAIEAE